MKKLQKSNNKIIAGVCGGIANYFGIDATIVRLAWVIFTFIWGIGFFAYIIAILIMPPSDLSSDDISNLKSANVNDEEKKSSAKKASSDSGKTRSDEEFDSYFKK